MLRRRTAVIALALLPALAGGFIVQDRASSDGARLLEVARADGRLTWRIALDELAQQLPLAQRYPSHLQRVLQPAHDMLIERGLLRAALIRQQQREWFVDYMLGSRPP